MIKVVMFHTIFFIEAMFSLLNIANAKPLSVTDFKTENHLQGVAFPLVAAMLINKAPIAIISKLEWKSW